MKKNTLVIYLFIVLILLLLSSSNNPKQNGERMVMAGNVSSSEEYDNATEYEKYYMNQLKIGDKYEIVRKDLIVKRDISEENRAQGMEKISRGDIVTLKSFPKGKYVQIENSEGVSFYETLKSFYDNSHREKDFEISKWIADIKYDALGYSDIGKFMLYLISACVFLYVGKKLLSILDMGTFTSLHEDVVAKDNGLFNFIPGAMLAALLNLIRLINEDKIAFYFLNKRILFGWRNMTFEMFFLVVALLILFYLLKRIASECFKTYAFYSASARLGLILVLNLLSFYICYSLYFLGIALYALFVVIQCIAYELPLPKEEEEAEDKTA